MSRRIADGAAGDAPSCSAHVNSGRELLCDPQSLDGEGAVGKSGGGVGGSDPKHL